MYRKEHPNPQFQRLHYEILNGKWGFYTKKQGETAHYNIEVPFCMESKLSGVEEKGFVDECIYEREFEVKSFNKEIEKLLLHFGAVDYEAKVYVNDVYLGKHCGGYTPFSFDISSCVGEGKNTLKVKVYDNIQDNVPSGKQSSELYSYGCFYTRTTGIWQTVWLEKMPIKHVIGVKYYPNVEKCEIETEIELVEEGNVEITVNYEGKTVGYKKAYVKAKERLTIELAEKHLWEPGRGRLYDVIIKYGNDIVYSYFGLREIKYDGLKFLVNGKSVFQKFVLDQGYYPDGIYTAPTEDDMIKDIQLGLDLGFNGARLHQKVFEPRFLYNCDKMGYMVWGEFPSWGIKYDNVNALGVLLQEWIESVERDFNHPSIILWCPLNETWKDLKDSRKVRDVRFIDAIYSATKSVDSTRPCVDVSGGFHGHKTDLYDFHCYESLESLKTYIENLNTGVLEVPLLYYENEPQLRYSKELPVNISEFGGIKYDPTDTEETTVQTINECAVMSTDDWGYGKGARSEEEFLERYEKLVNLLYKCPKLSGSCYTQLYDIEQEQNGFYTYDRRAKFSKETMKKIAEINSQKAVIEE